MQLFQVFRNSADHFSTFQDLSRAGVYRGYDPFPGTWDLNARTWSYGLVLSCGREAGRYWNTWHLTSVLTEVCYEVWRRNMTINSMSIHFLHSSLVRISCCCDEVQSHQFVWGRVGKSDARVDGFYFQLVAKDVLEVPQKGQTSQTFLQLHAIAREQSKSKKLLLSTIFLIHGSFFLVPFVMPFQLPWIA